MKKTTAVFTVFLTASVILTGVYGVQKGAAVSAAESGASGEGTVQSEEGEKEGETAEEVSNPDVPQIDTSLNIHAGSRVAVVSKSTKGRYWELVREGMENAVRDVNAAYGYEKDEQISMTFEGSDNELDVETQINTLDAVIAENPDVLCISAGDMNSCQAQLETARENGIPVVAFDSNVSETDLIYAYRGSDNVQIGRLAAQKLGEAIDYKGKVAVFSIQEKTQSIQERTEGFTEVIAEYPEIEIVEMVYQDQVGDMTAAMEGVLTLHPDLKGVFCTNADIADEFLSIEKKGENTAPILIGVDATESQQKAVRDGNEFGIISQNPYAIGYQTILAALSATVPGQEGAGDVIFEPVWIDAVNLDDPVYSSYIY